MRLRGVAAVVASLSLGLAVMMPASANAPVGPKTLVIGVGHVDDANQEMNAPRFFSYTAFYTPTVTVHTGDILDFQTAQNEFHVVALAPSGPALRASAPIFLPDFDPLGPGGVPDVAAGSGAPKALFGPGSFSLFNPPTCGVEAVGQPDCTFDGINPLSLGAIGGGHIRKFLQPHAKPTPALFNGVVDSHVVINAPPGTYDYLCLLHPGMNGKLTVVAPQQPTTTQGAINADSLALFAADRANALALEAADSTPTFTPDALGHKVFQAHMSDNTADQRVGIFEMMPRTLNLAVGDSVQWKQSQEVEIHSVSFPANSSLLPQVQGFDCGTSFMGLSFNGPPPTPPACAEPLFTLPNGTVIPEIILDPGSARPGHLTDPVGTLVDSGVLVASGYNLSPSVQDWSAIADKAGTYPYQCIVHDFMQATISVG